MNKQKILILQGLPASAKSAYARELMANEPNKWKRTNKDELRALIDNGVWSKDNEKLVLEIRDSIIIKSIHAGYNVIVDDTNFAPAHINDIHQIASLLSSGISKNNEREVEVEVKFFDVPVSECIRRDALRGDKSVGKKVIMDMYIKYVKKDIVMVQDEKAPKAAIFDIDGSLSDSKGRRGFYDWDKVGLDDCNEYLANIARVMAPTYKIIVVSGRDGSCYDITKKWLEDHNVPFDKLLMRKAGDMRPDDIVKEELFNEFIKEKYYVESVFDDRKKVILMWRRLGLNVLCLGDPDVEF